MAELTLTDEEREAPTYLEWDDADLGKAVKKAAADLADQQGKDSLFALTAGYILIAVARDTNATTVDLDLKGVTLRGQSHGDWRLTLEQVAEPENAEGDATENLKH